ncbi:MAG: hypothetical protein ACREAB_03285 [Blastocatellia bacterium]
MLNSNDVYFLLSRLCIELGFCLPPDEWNRLQENPPGEINEFTNKVFVAEGVDPQYAPRDLYRQVKAIVEDAFEKQAETESDEHPDSH